MPKLETKHIADRLIERLKQLEAGEDVALRELRSLLNAEQLAEMDAAWEQQQELRKKRRARSKEEELALGWLSKREIQIAAVRVACDAASENALETLEDERNRKEMRQAKTYMRAYFDARDDGKDALSAASYANNELTRAALTRVDGAQVRTMNQRDAEVRKVEDELRARIYTQMTADEREQHDMLQESSSTTYKKAKNKKS